ncbi:hypothetical protein QBC37DRAFT_434670 [Rhypophila decipiens]|uniref:2EXR domain-containing protein n=1 Tax=Rhypophila decipiens TaxID=261697 RepID=A0AAN6XW32_9PEZI|nr:hypothetical protein QBC37DRAFT_434670 [Rhypophila decipiens]
MSDASEDSDHFDGLVQEHDDTESDSAASHSHSDAADSDSDGESLMGNALFDISAEEADETGSDDESNSDDADGLDGYVNRVERSGSPQLHFFPQFKRLPIELRYRIWELFCPEILAKGRVYPFTPQKISDPESGEYRMQLVPDVHLGMMTESSRAALAVDSESRRFATAAFPDILCFQGGTLRFNKGKDIILINRPDSYYPLESDLMNQVRNIAFSTDAMDPQVFFWSRLHMLRFWEIPGSIYMTLSVPAVLEEDFCSITWCGEREHHHYRTEVYESQHGLGEDLEYHWVWPNVDKHPDYTKYWFDGSGSTYKDWVARILDEDAISFYRVHLNLNIPDLKEIETKFLPILRPMIEFLGSDEDRLFEKLVRVADRGPDWDGYASELDDDESDEPDEYESEGIDDSDIEEPEENSEDEDDGLVVLDDDSGGEDEGSTFAGFSPLQEHSSPELDEDESQTARGSDSEEDEDVHQWRPRARGSRSRSRAVESADEDEAPAKSAPGLWANKRKRVLDSDDEDDVVEIDDDDEAPRKRIRTSKSSLVVVPDDDSEDETGRTRKIARRSRPIVVDDDDDGDSEEDDEAEDGEDDDEVRGTSRPLTLMERLELHRRDNPTPGEFDDDDDDDNGEDPGIEEMGEDDYDARNYGGFEDDDEGMDPSDDAGDGEGIDYDEGYDEEDDYY